jgi:Na+/phosphate symporter
MVIYLAPLVALAGCLMFGFGNAKVARLGEIMFFCGLLVTLMTMSSGSFRLH